MNRPNGAGRDWRQVAHAYLGEGRLESGGLLIGGALLLSVREAASVMEAWHSAGLLLIGTLFIALGSARIGRASLAAEAAELAHPLVKPAFRRTMTLYRALGRLADSVSSDRLRYASHPNARKIASSEVAAVLMLIEARLLEQVDTSEDAVDEWSEVMVDEVAALRMAAKGRDV